MVGLALLLTAEVGTLTFSFMGAFSIGRFAAVAPVLISAYVIGMGRSRVAVGACVCGAVITYLLFSWLFTPLGFNGGLLALVFGFWAIPVYAVFAVVAFGSSFAKLARRRETA